MNIRRIVITGAAALALVAGGTAAGATLAGPVDGSGVIHACYATAASGGQHAILLEDAGHACPSGMTAITWNQQGPQGQTGVSGPAGPQGPGGPQGPSGPAGPAGATGPQGPKGDTGAQGPAGPAGADGNTVLSGTGTPDNSLGKDGDFYVDTAASVLYGPKADGSWSTPGTSLVGAAGPAGATGPMGPQGPPGGSAGGLDSMIGTPCEVGTPSAGTLDVTYTPHTNAPDTVSLTCGQFNSHFALNVAVGVGTPVPTCGGPVTNCPTFKTGRGQVTSQPGSINCTESGGTCTDVFKAYTVVTLTAAPAEDSASQGPSGFAGWTGCDSTSGPDGETCTVTMAAVRNVTATFQAAPLP